MFRLMWRQKAHPFGGISRLGICLALVAGC